MNLFQYLFFCAFYFVVVFMQADVYNGYSVVSSVRRAVVPLDGEGYPVTTMSGPNQILDWLLASASPVWVDEVCGDGVCNSPFEFPAYGRFGCRADCGSNTNLTTMLLQVRADFRDDLYAPQALRAAASWNLCKRDEAATKAGFPDVCWWQEDRAFVKIVENHLETVNVPPDELWFVAVKGDYMGRVVGNVFIAENNSLPWVGTVPEWKACPRNVVSSRRNVAATSSARRMLLEVEKHADGAGASARDASARGKGERNRVTSHKRRAAPGETLETLVNADTTAGSRRKLLGGGVDVAASAIDWMDQRADDFVDFWTSRDAAPAAAPAAPVLSSTSAFENGISPSKTLTAKAETRVPERRSLLGDRDDAFRFDGATVGAAAAVYDTSNWGSTLTTKMTFEAWVKPALVGSNFNTTLVMSGDYDWGIMLVCGGGGSGCCGAHADGEYFPIPTFRLCDWPYETDTFLLISGAVAFFTGASTSDPGSECAAMPSSTSGLVAGVWSHVAVVVDVDAPFVSFYLNGEPSGTNTTVQMPSGLFSGGVSDTFKFGCSHSTCTPGGSCGCFVGQMDDMRVYNDSLSSTSIATWYWNQAAEVFGDGQHPDAANAVARYDAGNAIEENGALRVPNSVVFLATGTDDIVFTTAFSNQPPMALLSDRGAMSLDFGVSNSNTSVYESDVDSVNGVNATGAMTLEAWIKPSSVTQTQMLVSNGELGWAVALVCGGAGEGCCGTHANGTVAFMSSQALGDCAALPSSATVVAVDQWTHVAVAVDTHAEVVHFFINGVSTTADRVASPGVFLATDTLPVAFGGVFGCATCMRFSGRFHAAQVWQTFLGKDSTQLPGGIGTRKAMIGAIADLGDETASSDDGTYDRVLTFVADDARGDANATVADRSPSGGFFTFENARFVFDAPNFGYGVFTEYTGVAPVTFSDASMLFNGVDAFGLVPFNDAISLDVTTPNKRRALSFEAWIKPSDSNETMTIVGNDDGGWLVMRHCNHTAPGVANTDCCPGINAGALAFYPGGELHAAGTSFCNSLVWTTDSVPTLQWTHVSVVVDSTVSRVDIFLDSAARETNQNGTAGGSHDLTSFASHASVFGASRGLGVGTRRPGCRVDCAHFRGFIAGVRVWNAPVPPAYRGVTEAFILERDSTSLVASFRPVDGVDAVVPNAAIGTNRAHDLQLVNVVLVTGGDRKVRPWAFPKSRHTVLSLTLVTVVHTSRYTRRSPLFV